MIIVTLAYLVTPSEVWLAPKNKKVGVGLLNGYGGQVKEHETIIQAALRETKEESRVEVSAKDLIHITTINIFRGDEHRFQCHIFLITRWGGEPQETEEMGIPEKFPRNKLPLARMLPGDSLWLPEVMIGRPIPQGGFVRYNKDMTRVIESHLPAAL